MPAIAIPQGCTPNPFYCPAACITVLNPCYNPTQYITNPGCYMQKSFPNPDYCNRAYTCQELFSGIYCICQYANIAGRFITPCEVTPFFCVCPSNYIKTPYPTITAAELGGLVEIAQHSCEVIFARPNASECVISSTPNPCYGKAVIPNPCYDPHQYVSEPNPKYCDNKYIKKPIEQKTTMSYGCCCGFGGYCFFSGCGGGCYAVPLSGCCFFSGFVGACYGGGSGYCFCSGFGGGCYGGGSGPCIFSGIGSFFNNAVCGISGFLCNTWYGAACFFGYGGAPGPGCANPTGTPFGFCCVGNYCFGNVFGSGIGNIPGANNFCYFGLCGCIFASGFGNCACPLLAGAFLCAILNCPTSPYYNCQYLGGFLQKQGAPIGGGGGGYRGGGGSGLPASSYGTTAPMYCPGTGKLNFNNHGYYLNCSPISGHVISSVSEPCGSVVKTYSCGKIITSSSCGFSESWAPSNTLSDLQHSTGNTLNNLGRGLSGGLSSIGGGFTTFLNDVGAFFTSPTMIILFIALLIGVGVAIHFARSGSKDVTSRMPIVPLPV